MGHNDMGRFDGIPGLVRYSSVRKVPGRDLKLGHWLDSLDHRGARMIYGLWFGSAPAEDLYVSATRLRLSPRSNVMTVMFSCGDTEQIHANVEYDVVDPDSQVAPDGSPL